MLASQSQNCAASCDSANNLNLLNIAPGNSIPDAPTLFSLSFFLSFFLSSSHASLKFPKMSHHGSTASSLFVLPLEVRLLIYGHLADEPICPYKGNIHDSIRSVSRRIRDEATPVLLRRVRLFLVANRDEVLSTSYLFKSSTFHYIEIPWLSFIGSTYSPWLDQFDQITLSHRRYIGTCIAKKRREKAKIRIHNDERTEKAWFRYYQRKTEDWLADLDYYSMQGLDRIMVGFEAHSDKVMEDWAKIREGEEDFPEDFKIPRF
jgi:hypothetical protein